MKNTNEIIKLEIVNEVLFYLEPILWDMKMLIAEVSQVLQKE